MTPQIRRRRRLLLVTPFFPAHGGGVEGVAGELSRQMLRLDADLHIEWLAASGDALPAPTSRLRAQSLRTCNGVEKALGVPVLLPWPRALARLWRAVRRCDAGHLHDFAYPANLAAALFFQIQKKPYLVTQHIGAVPFQNPFLRHLLSFINGTAGVWALSRAAQTVFISEQVRREFAIPGALLIPNGVDATIFCPPENPGRKLELRRQLGFDAGAPLVLFVGRFVEKKGVPLLVKLSRQMPDVQWIFAGHGPLDPSREIGANARVLRGWQGARIADLCRAADLFVLPSRGEGFPLVVQEALACGTPVLAETALGMASPAAREWMNLEPLGQADDAARWEKRLRALLTEIARDAEREAQNRAARAAFARREWSWESGARRYLEILEDIAV